MSIFGFLKPNKDKIYDKGVDALRTGKCHDAIRYFSEVIQIDKHDAQAHYNLAMARIATDNFKEAYNHIKEFESLVPDNVDDELKEFFNVLEKASALDTLQAKELLKSYTAKEKQESEQTVVADKVIRLDDLLELSDKFLFDENFSKSESVEKFGKAMSAKIPLRFYSIPAFTHLDPKDAFGFGIAFISTGYAVAKASLILLGPSVYFSALSKDVVQQICNSNLRDGMPITYNLSLMKKGNPIAWCMINNALEVCIGNNLVKFISRYPNAKDKIETIKEHLVKEFIYIGYYIGLWENSKQYSP